MADIELVIKIPDYLYEDMKNSNTIFREDERTCYEAVKNGTPLPKGHGRLIDAGALKFYEIDEIGGEYNPYLGCSKEQIDEAPTIIEAENKENKK